jgi:hypothetical protein
MQDSTSLTPATSSGSLGRELSRRSTASSSSASSLPDDHEGCGRFSNISSSSNGSSYSMHASRVLWVAGMNGGPDNDVHGLKIIFQQIIGPGDYLVALVLFDRIPSELGIAFKFTPGGFRTAGDQKQLHWLTEKLLYWRNQLEGLAAYCNQKNVIESFSPLSPASSSAATALSLTSCMLISIPHTCLPACCLLLHCKQ